MKKIFIVAKEDTIGLAASSFDFITKSTTNYDPIIILLNTLKEIKIKNFQNLFVVSKHIASSKIIINIKITQLETV